MLLRAFTHVDAYEEALGRAGLAPYVVGGRGYWSQQQVEDVLRAAGTIANPLDDEALFGALASPAVRGQPRRALAAAPRRGGAPHVAGGLVGASAAGASPDGREPAEWLDRHRRPTASGLSAVLRAARRDCAPRRR